MRYRQITICNAGHPPLLMISGSDAKFLEAPIGRPIGVRRDSHYEQTTIPIPPGSTIIGYTDGLIERTGESIDDGTGRLRRSAIVHAMAPLPLLLDSILSDLSSGDLVDDIAIMGLKWRT